MKDEVLTVQPVYRMMFHIDNFFYLRFWSAALNALLYWELIRLHNRWLRPHYVTLSHCVVKFIRIMPILGD